MNSDDATRGEDIGSETDAESDVQTGGRSGGLSGFVGLVEDALEGLPEELAALLDNVVITVEDWPDAEEALVRQDPAGNLYGLYEGVPLTERGPGYYGVMPDRITIFRGPLERDFPNEELEEQVQITVIHELAHHFGFDEDKLEELGWG